MSQLKDIADALRAGKLILSEGELAGERMKVCQECQCYRKLTRQCSLCNCFLDLKTRMLSASCPLELW